MAQPVLTDEQKAQPVSVIYFRKSSGNAMKRLGTRIRDQGAQTRLVWANNFKGPDNINPQARAIVIEKGCPNEGRIVQSYERFAHDVEIHFVDSEGQFIEVDNSDRSYGADPAVPELAELAIDPTDAIKNLKPDPVPEPVADPEPSTDSDGPAATDEVSSEIDQPEEQ